VNAKVIAVEYDPNRNARIVLINYFTGQKSYILHPRDLNVSSVIISDFDAPVKIGNALPLSKIPLGTNVHNIEFQV
jgi:large subunit ribosomal protein L2